MQEYQSSPFSSAFNLIFFQRNLETIPPNPRNTRMKVEITK